MAGQSDATPHDKKHNGAISGGAPGAPGPWGSVCLKCVFRINLAGHVLGIPWCVPELPVVGQY
eukprot:616598-Heterocapsa_arctica.AAC.1